MSLKRLLAAFLLGPEPETEAPAAPDQPDQRESDPTYQERADEQRRILTEALKESVQAYWSFRCQVEYETLHQRWVYTDEYSRIVAEQPILKDTPRARIKMVIALTYWLTEKTKSLDDVKLIDTSRHRRAVQFLITRLFNYKLPYTPADLTLVLNLLARHTERNDTFYLYYYPVSTMLKRVEELVESSSLTPDMERALKRFREIIVRKNTENRRIRLRLRALLGETVLTSLDSDLPWVDGLKGDIQEMEGAQRQAWETLIEHSLSPRSSKPSQVWLDKGREIVDAIGEETFKAYLVRWLVQVELVVEAPIPENIEDMLRGMIWACILVDDIELAHVIGELTLVCFERVRTHEDRNLKAQKAGYACLYTLSRMASDAAVGELCRIRSRVKLADLRRKVATALNEAASRRGLDLSALEICPLKVRVEANSPNLWPTIFSLMKTGTCLLPSWTPIVCPTI